MYWFRLADKLPTGAGLHRWSWNLRFAPPPAPLPEYTMATAFGQNTTKEPEGPQVMPGTYIVRLTVDGKRTEQNVYVGMDPRVRTLPEDLSKQFTLETKIYSALQQGDKALAEIHEFYKRNRVSPAPPQKLEAVSHIEPQAPEAGQQGQGRSQAPTLSRTLGTLERLAVAADSADTAPTMQITKAVDENLQQLEKLVGEWEKIR